MNRGRFFLLVVAFAVAAAAALIILHWTSGRGREPFEADLSFKPFTVQQLLDFDIEIDAATCGRPVKSAELNRLWERVSEVRGLSAAKQVEFIELSTPCLRAKIIESAREESPSEEIEADEKLLIALGLIPPNEDLENTITDVLTEQIAGTYDTEEKHISLVKGKGTGSLTDEVTLAHEMTHALQDQHFGLDKPPLEDERHNGDNNLAVLSLIEGDAMVTMLEYARRYVDLERLIQEELTGGEISMEQLEKAPRYIQRSLLFPYEEGLAFAQALWDKGGFAAIDSAYKDPPMSSEQIMHPYKYTKARDNPRPVPVPDISESLGRGWELINEDCMGEFDVQVWFEEFVSLMDAKDAAGGWGGNNIHYYQGPGDEFVLVNRFVWDSQEDSSEFFRLYERLVRERFGKAASRTGRSRGSYVYEAEGQIFYCGLNADGVLCVQATGGESLKKALENFPECPRPTGL